MTDLCVCVYRSNISFFVDFFKNLNKKSSHGKINKNNMSMSTVLCILIYMLYK